MFNYKKIPKNKYHFIVVLSIISYALIFSGLLTGLSTPHYAYAHSLPVTENPAANSIIPKGAALPSKLTIDFSERPSPAVSSIEVLNAKNEVVSNGDFKVIGDGGREAMTTLDTKKLTDGVYTVSWETQSLDDGHIAKGSFVFGIGNVGPGAAASITSGKALQQASTFQSVTSPLDGLVKWPIIVSQAAVVGGIFSHLFLWENFGSKIKGRKVARNGFGYDKAKIPWLRRFFILLVASSVAILAAGTSYLFLEITELSPHNNISSYWSVFVSQISGASGIQWIMRSITSLIVIAFAVSYYYVVKRNIPMTTDTANIESRHNDRERNEKEHNSKINKPNFTSSLLYIALVAGSGSIFSNSVTSHNAGVHFVPSLSISLDWLHFMAVSIWVGGLFYISTVLLSTIRSRAATHAVTFTSDNIMKTGSPTNNPSNIEYKYRSIFVYYLALLLPRFSILATISLGVIGVSGLYMAWIQLHSLNSLFSSSYGNILIIKLSIALPLVLLGAYHQLRLHKNAVLVASIGKVGRGERRGGFEADINSNVGQRPISQSVHNNGDEISNNDNFKDKAKVNDIPSKFSKTIKIESLIAIGVLLAASLLTITSPPAMNMAMSSMSSSSASTMSGMSGMPGMSMTPVKNSTYAIQTKIMNVDTKIEINPFYSGFNTFKVTFTDAAGKPYSKVSTTEIVFGNAAADISNVVANLQKIRPGVFSVTGAYISQPGEWDISLSAQRVQDLDLNYEFTAKVTNAPPAPQNTGAVSQTTNTNNIIQEPPPRFDSFAWIAIVLAATVVLGSIFYYRRSKQELRKTVEMLKVD